MKKRNLIAIGAAVILLAGCFPSVNPFYTDKDVVFDPHLLGEWQGKDANNPETWLFEQSTNKGFDVTLTEEGKTGKFRAHLFKVKDAQFLDVIPSDCNYATNQADVVAYSMFPGHLLLRVTQIDPELTFASCDYEWLQKFLETNPGAVAHHKEYDSIVLTDTTANLQKFVMKHLGTNELFKEYGTMVRRSKP